MMRDKLKRRIQTGSAKGKAQRVSFIVSVRFFMLDSLSSCIPIVPGQNVRQKFIKCVTNPLPKFH
jgi:hypothetical protein